MTNPENLNILEENPLLSKYKTISNLKIALYFFLSVLIFTGIMAIFLPKNIISIFSIAACSAIIVFLYFTSSQLSQDSTKGVTDSNISQKANLYTSLLDTADEASDTSMTLAREQALLYCQELINDYKKTRKSSRNIYYASQFTTIVFSSITPVLILLDKLEADNVWIKWLPIIFPALAAIIASISTSFPFQENYIGANTTVELLEAEEAKFILGVSQLYRCYDIVNPAERQKMLKQTIDNFINQVNTIHLKQVQELSLGRTKSEENSEESN